MCNGIFGDMFDFDNDGKLDAFEQVAELCFLDEIINDDDNSDCDIDDDNFLWWLCKLNNI